jgi:hypothetical protein
VLGLDPAGTRAVDQLILELAGRKMIFLVTRSSAQARRAGEECLFMLLSGHGRSADLFLRPMGSAHRGIHRGKVRVSRSGTPPLPLGGIACGVQNRDYGDCGLPVLEEDGVREPAQEPAAVVGVGTGEGFRSALDVLQARLQALEEILSQAAAPVLVPRVCLNDVLFGGWREQQVSGHGGCAA